MCIGLPKEEEGEGGGGQALRYRTYKHVVETFIAFVSHLQFHSIPPVQFLTTADQGRKKKK